MKKILLISIIVFGLASVFLLGAKFLKSPTKNISVSQLQASQSPNNVFLAKDFNGEKGTEVFFDKAEIKLDAAIFADHQARFYNVKMPDNKIIYFFVVKDKNGIYHAAANACQVCFSARKGFHQEGDEIVCNNCGNRYPLEKIATEKGGCNPAPINPNLEVANGRLTITQAELAPVAGFF